MTEYEMWVKSCRDVGTEIVTVEKAEAAQTGIYQTQRKFMHEGREYGGTPSYNAWVLGKRMYCGPSLSDARKAYNEYIETVDGSTSWYDK